MGAGKMSSRTRAATLNKDFSLVAIHGLSFLITDRPTDQTVASYVEALQTKGVTDLVRVADPSYSTESVEAAGIKVHDRPYDDGTNPPADVISYWLELVARAAGGGGTIAVHCVAGLGRAPVMVAIALIERGMTPEDAISFIRERRRGAINAKQLQFLLAYKPTGKFRAKKGKDGCAVM